MSPSQTLLESDFNHSLQIAKKHISENEDSQRLIRLLFHERLKKLTKKNQKEINKLAQLGVINLHMDNTISLSKLGRKVIKELI